MCYRATVGFCKLLLAVLWRLICCVTLCPVKSVDCGYVVLQTFLPNVKVHAYFAPVTPPPSVGGGRRRFCRCCAIVWCTYERILLWHQCNNNVNKWTIKSHEVFVLAGVVFHRRQNTTASVWHSLLPSLNSTSVINLSPQMRYVLMYMLQIMSFLLDRVDKWEFSSFKKLFWLYIWPQSSTGLEHISVITFNVCVHLAVEFNVRLC